MSTMRNSVLTAAAALLLAGCGGGDTVTGQPPTSTPDETIVATIVVQTDVTEIASDGSQSATITATFLDANNAVVSGVTGSMSADMNGLVVVASPESDTNGQIIGTLFTGGDTSLRTITVTVSVTNSDATTATSTITVDVVDPAASSPLNSLDLIVDANILDSSGANPVNLIAIARDTNNIVVEGVTVTFSTTSGGLQNVSNLTDASGQATAQLTTAGNKTNRTITVTAAAEGLTDTVNVSVLGTLIAIQGQSSMAFADTAEYDISVTDSSGAPITFEPVTVTSANGNALTSGGVPITGTVDTDASGLVSVFLTDSNGADDVLTATAAGATGTKNIAVSADSFAFQTPAASAEVDVNTVETITVRWMSAGTPVVGQQVTFSSNRGAITGSPATTDGSGDATVTITSAQAGASTILATTVGGPSAQRSIEFVATTPDTITVQASPSTVGPNETATISAVVRDDGTPPNQNLVKNVTVEFILTDATGGTLSAGEADTNSQGVASVVYTASDVPSGSGSITVEARVKASPAITDTVALTTASVPASIVLGTGNVITETADGTRYELPYTVTVSDINGGGVAGASVTLEIKSTDYYEGFWARGTDTWVQTINAFCTDEDANENGILDSGEDFNTSGFLEAANIAIASSPTVVTDETGVATFNIIYPQEFANWVTVRVTGTASVAGSESSRVRTLFLPIASDDIQLATTPPGVISPWGNGDSDCSTLGQ